MGSKQTAETKDLTPYEYRALRPFVAGQAQDWVTTGGPAYEGAFAAPITAAETEMLGDIRSQALVPTAGETAAGTMRLGTLQGRYLTPESNPALDAYIQAAVRPIRSAYLDENMAAKALFSRAGQRIQESSPFSRLQIRSNEAYLNAIKDATAQIVAPAYEAERGRQMEASTQEREQAQMAFDRAQGALEAQALPRLIEQYGIDAGREEFARRTALLAEILGLTANLTMPTPATESESTGWGMGMGGSMNIQAPAQSGTVGG